MSDPTTSPAGTVLRRRPRGRLSRNLNAVGLALALVWLALIATTIAPEADDFKWYWQGARSVLTTGDPYQLRDDPAGPSVQPTPGAQEQILYSYPPLFAYIMLPFALLNYQAAQWLWFAFNAALLAAFVTLCVRLSGARAARRRWGLVAFAVVLTPPARLSLQLGQVSILIALLLAGTLALERRSALAGGLLALASWVKLTPALVGLFYALRGPRRVLWWAIGVAMLLFAVSLALFGWTPYTSFVNQVVLGRAYPYAAEHNISLYGFWTRLLTSTPYAAPLVDAQGLARALTALSSLAVLGLCVWASRRPAKGLRRELLLCLWLCGMSLLSPSNGYYNLVLLLLPLLLLVRALELRPDPATRNWLMAGTLLVCIPPTWTDSVPALYNAAHSGPGLLMLTPSLYGLLIYTVLLAREVRRS